MFRTLQEDRAFIEQKYHDPKGEFDPFSRMAYHGYAFDESTGLSDEEMDAGLAALSDTLQGLSHPVHKARLFAYVLDNTRIDVSAHDYFVGIWSWGRMLSKYVQQPWQQEVTSAYPEATAVLKDFDTAGISYGWVDFEHTVPDWDSLMALGFPGILRRAKEAFAALASPTETQTAMFEGICIEYEAILRLLDRMSKYAEAQHFEKAPKIAACLRNLRDGAPKDSFDAMQLIYLYFMLSESVDNYQVRSLGHGLDSTLLPFWTADTECGRYTEEELSELLAYFLLQWSSIGNYWGQPFYLGGRNPDGSTKVSFLSRKILDVYDKLGIYNPKIQLKVNSTMPRDILRQALNMVRRGNSSIVFCNDEAIERALLARGASPTEAVDSVISGCYEYKVKAKGIGISCTYFNALKPISYVFTRGYEHRLDRAVGPDTGDPAEFPDFDRFFAAYLTQFAAAFDAYLCAMNTLEQKVQDINPSLMFSATVLDCVNSMTDALDCGLENTTDVLISALGTAADALMAVRELVYVRKTATIETLKAALEANWVGFEDLRSQALSCPKYGNGNPAADSCAAGILRFAHDRLDGKRNSHGGRFILELHSARAFIIHGEKMDATPDGRKAGEETSKNASPTPGADKEGITALIRSVTTLNSDFCTNGSCLDAMLHPSAVEGESGLSALEGVIDTYRKLGGHSIHFNIFSTDDLRDAQAHPEKYPALQVRICGWNALWNNVAKQEQDAYILRSENIG